MRRPHFAAEMLETQAQMLASPGRQHEAQLGGLSPRPSAERMSLPSGGSTLTASEVTAGFRRGI